MILGLSIVVAAIYSQSTLGLQSDQPDRFRAFRYAIIEIPSLGGGLDVAYGMNDLGHVVGKSLIADQSEFHAFDKTFYD